MQRLIIDTETTGLSPRFNKTLTVGLLSIDVKPTKLKILNQNHIFIKHNNHNSTKEAMKNNTASKPSTHKKKKEYQEF